MKYLKFGALYPKEIYVFKDFMNEDSFLEWYSKNPQYSFEVGQEPKASNFTKKKFKAAQKKPGSSIPSTPVQPAIVANKPN